MTKTIFPLLLIAYLGYLSGCQKSDTFFLRSARKCQVKEIIQTGCCGPGQKMVFSYNKMGDPVTITQLPTTHTGAPNYFFRYDKKHRLTELMALYEGATSGLFYHKYFYANQGNSDIVIDSIYFFPQFTNNVLTWYHSSVASYLFYDKAGRIIKDSSVTDAGTTTVTDFVYDANGNLTGRSYDTYLNPHQTHKIWMFLDRDYSVNNPFVASFYNTEGLPTLINLSAEDGNYLRFLTAMRNASLIYECR